MNHIFRKRDKNNKFRWLSRGYQLGSLKKTHFDDGIFFRSTSVIGFELPKYKHWLWKELLTPKFMPNETYECDDDDDGNIESKLLLVLTSWKIYVHFSSYIVSEYVVPGVIGDVFSVIADVLIAPNNEGVLEHSRTLLLYILRSTTLIVSLLNILLRRLSGGRCFFP